jgi:hypothetical protein
MNTETHTLALVVERKDDDAVTTVWNKLVEAQEERAKAVRPDAVAESRGAIFALVEVLALMLADFNEAEADELLDRVLKDSEDTAHEISGSRKHE